MSDAHFLCHICGRAMVDPVTLPCCSRTQCLVCAKEIVDHDGDCRLCGAKVNPETDLIPLKFLGELIRTKRAIEAKRSRSYCFVCELHGHFTRFCPQLRCVICEEFGHVELVCPEKRFAVRDALLLIETMSFGLGNCTQIIQLAIINLFKESGAFKLLKKNSIPSLSLKK